MHAARIRFARPVCRGDLEVQPFPVPHDAREPAQMVLSDGDLRLEGCSPMSARPPAYRVPLRGCDAPFLEANHCEDMLANSRYPRA